MYCCDSQGQSEGSHTDDEWSQPDLPWRGFLLLFFVLSFASISVPVTLWASCLQWVSCFWTILANAEDATIAVSSICQCGFTTHRVWSQHMYACMHLPLCDIVHISSAQESTYYFKHQYMLGFREEIWCSSWLHTGGKMIYLL